MSDRERTVDIETEPAEPNQATDSAEPTEATEPTGPQLVDEDLLVEDVSIDGMCGVY